MLTVDADKRLTIDECLEHPWTLNQGKESISVTDSTDGLTGAMNSLDFSKRKVQRQRTLLADINDIKVTKVIDVKNEVKTGHDGGPKKVKVWEKNPEGKKAMVQSDANKEMKKGNKTKAHPNGHAEEHLAANRQQEEFMAMGGRGDMQLFGDDASSRYLPEEVPS